MRLRLPRRSLFAITLCLLPLAAPAQPVRAAPDRDRDAAVIARLVEDARAAGIEVVSMYVSDGETNQRELDMDVEGNCYYSYLFMAQSWATGNWGYIVAYGDLDSDGIFSQKNQQYQTDWSTGAFKLTWEWPPAGQDDPTTF